MSSGYRDDRPALVVLFLMVGSIIVISALGLWSRQAFNGQITQPSSASTESYQEQHGPAEGYWWPEFSTRDTYAQWAMMAFTAIGTGVALLGLKWIRRTFVETRKTAAAAISANEIAREIGQKQTRAYLTCLGASYKTRENWLIINLQVKNVGQSPAVSCKSTGRIVVSRYVVETKIPESWTGSSRENSGERIAPGEVGEIALIFWMKDAPHSLTNSVRDEWTHISGNVFIGWTDVFDQTQGVSCDISKNYSRDSEAGFMGKSHIWLTVDSQISWNKDYDRSEMTAK